MQTSPPFDSDPDPCRRRVRLGRPRPLDALASRARQGLRGLGKRGACERALLDVSRALDGRLSPVEARALDLHLDACAECSRAAAQLRELRGALRSLRLAPPPSLRVVAGAWAARPSSEG